MRRSFAVGLVLAAVPTVGFAPPEKGAAPKASPPARKATAHDPDAVAREYLAAWRKIEQKALGMTGKHARDFKKASYSTLVKKMFTAYGFTEPDLKAAIKGYEARLAEEKKAAVDAAANAEKFGEAGYVGTVHPGRTVGASYLAISEAFTLMRADDDVGLQKLIDKKAIVIAAEPIRVRVLEVFDYRRADKGHWLRVRVLDGKAAGSEAFCFPSGLTPVR